MDGFYVGFDVDKLREIIVIERYVEIDEGFL